MVTALEVFDSLQENIKKIKEGQFDSNNNNNGKNVKNSGSKNSIKSNGNEKNNNNNANKNSFIINENINTNINNNIKININNNNIYSYENSKSNSKTKKKAIDNNHNTSKERKPILKINNNGVQNTKAKPVNIFSNKSHYIPVSNNKSNNINNSIKANSKGKAVKKSNEITNNTGKKIICHPSSATGNNKAMNNSGVMRKNVKVGSNISNNNIPTGKIQINKIGKMTTASVLNKPKPVSAKIKK
jgi:hypothetical protein